MPMHNPPHPGEFTREVFLTPFSISVRKAAESLGVSSSTLHRLVKGQHHVSPEMALRLSKSLGRTPESWLEMQSAFDLWNARKELDLTRVKKLTIPSQEG